MVLRLCSRIRTRKRVKKIKEEEKDKMNEITFTKVENEICLAIPIDFSLKEEKLYFSIPSQTAIKDFVTKKVKEKILCKKK